MQLGPPRQVYTRPANKTVADFMGLVNLIPGRVVGAAGSLAGEAGTADEIGWATTTGSRGGAWS